MGTRLWSQVNQNGHSFVQMFRRFESRPICSTFLRIADVGRIRQTFFRFLHYGRSEYRLRLTKMSDELKKMSKTVWTTPVKNFFRSVPAHHVVWVIRCECCLSTSQMFFLRVFSILLAPFHFSGSCACVYIVWSIRWRAIASLLSTPLLKNWH